MARDLAAFLGVLLIGVGLYALGAIAGYDAGYTAATHLERPLACLDTPKANLAPRR